MKRRHVFILYTHALFARGVEKMLRDRRGLEIVGIEADWRKGLLAIGSLHPEVVILDSAEGGMEPLAATKEIMERSPETRVIALTLRDNKMHLYQTRETVASDVEDLLRAIREKARGRRR